MDRIKSAYEKALERFQQRGEVPQEELDRMEYRPKGQNMAASFLRDDHFDLYEEINKYPQSIRRFILEGAQETLLANIQLPADNVIRDTNKKALEGIYKIKVDKRAAGEVIGQFEYFFQYYEQAYNQNFRNFRDSFSAKLNATLKSMERQTGVKGKVEPERHPKFREEWLKILGQLNSQYEMILAEQKQKLREIS